jgi:hypothetical protein
VRPKPDISIHLEKLSGHSYFAKSGHFNFAATLDKAEGRGAKDFPEGNFATIVL